ncbi:MULTISPECIES: hypothetical protein [unclassified Pseudomonas]
MLTHYKTAGHLACGRHGDSLVSTTELTRVKCRNWIGATAGARG